MSAFEDLLKKVYDGDPDKATEDIMSALKLSKHQRDVLRPCVRASVSNGLKDMNRQAEVVALGLADVPPSMPVATNLRKRHNAQAPLPEYTPPADKFEMTLPELRQLLPVEFAIGGRRISWGDATINDHRAAEQARRTVARGHLIHADRHAQAIRALERSGCDTLGELFARKAAA